jgi:hypothetical protein
VRLSRPASASPKDIARLSSIDKSSNRSVRAPHEYPPRPRLSGLKEYIEELGTEVPRGPPDGARSRIAVPSAAYLERPMSSPANALIDAPL